LEKDDPGSVGIYNAPVLAEIRKTRGMMT